MKLCYFCFMVQRWPELRLHYTAFVVWPIKKLDWMFYLEAVRQLCYCSVQFRFIENSFELVFSDGNEIFSKATPNVKCKLIVINIHVFCISYDSKRICVIKLNLFLYFVHILISAAMSLVGNAMQRHATPHRATDLWTRIIQLSTSKRTKLVNCTPNHILIC